MRHFHYSLRAELLLVCFVISVIPIITMQIVFYNLSEHYIEQKINSLTNKNLSYMQINIESDLEYYKGILYRIAADDAITEDEVKVKSGNDFTRESYGVNLRDSLASYADIRDEIVGVTYVSSSYQSVFYDKRNMSATNYLWDGYSLEEKKKYTITCTTVITSFFSARKNITTTMKKAISIISASEYGI